MSNRCWSGHTVDCKFRLALKVLSWIHVGLSGIRMLVSGNVHDNLIKVLGLTSGEVSLHMALNARVEMPH